MVTKNFLDFMGQMGILETQRNVGLFPTHVRNVCMIDRQNEWRKLHDEEFHDFVLLTVCNSSSSSVGATTLGGFWPAYCM